MATADLHEWWLATETEDPAPTHIITFRPVLRVRLALAPGADATRVIAAAVAAWTDGLSSTEEGPVAWAAELWQRPLGDDGLVVGVEVVAAETDVETEEGEP